MRKWTHPQDFVALVAGVYAALSPIWTSTTTKASWTMVVLGVLTAAVAIASLARPDMMSSEGALAVLGIAFIVAPWVMSYSGSSTRALAWTSWIVGIVTLAVGARDLQMTRSAHRGGGVAAAH
ncbi:SPW repeat domain-containing protein [Oryzihumus leptocrescens]|uniref:SPW repeat-containing protein n=1 Tax=Oryzihumus leptocrescens TaxID=297536 RepID=A0A542Z9J7_9MICO|nr:SPW repeat protein [Oryzihumus leptocrescens]TQL57019.1 SPW repeat-containing protein [Oryzihumus leptocrescens]